MEKEINIRDKRAEGGLRFLLCDPTGNVELSFPEGQWVPSTIQCLNKAVNEKPRIIVIRFGKIPIRQRDALVELSAALKQNSRTQTCLLLSLLHSKHRKLLEDLNRAGVDFVKFIGESTLGSIQMRKIIDELGPDDRLERHLELVCHFLHYSEIDSKHEMAVCGAYLDRMVLGGRRLHELCETGDHLHCEYYLKPRNKS
jgi:hypothetical protein